MANHHRWCKVILWNFHNMTLRGVISMLIIIKNWYLSLHWSNFKKIEKLLFSLNRRCFHFDSDQIVAFIQALQSICWENEGNIHLSWSTEEGSHAHALIELGIWIRLTSRRNFSQFYQFVGQMKATSVLAEVLRKALMRMLWQNWASWFEWIHEENLVTSIDLWGEWRQHPS